MLAYIGIMICGGGVFYACRNLLSGELEGAAASRLEVAGKQTKNALLRMSRPIYAPLIMPYTTKFEAVEWRKKWKRKIISAGLEDELDVDDLMAFRVHLGLIVPSALLVYFLLTGTNISWWLIGFMMIGGYFYPTMWVNGTRSRRQFEIQLQLPFVIDLLTLSTEAGLDFIGALQKVVEKTRNGPLVSEIERMLQQIQLGTTRADALRDFGWRVDLQEISSLVAVLVTADQMGSPLGAVLRVQSDLIRTQRFTNAEKKGAAASQKLLFPLIFFIMPAVFIMIFGPVILGFLGGK
ncbi:type II secretion system F family protein [bacterium]|nr:type II secretion system F family protein [bacterium]